MTAPVEFTTWRKSSFTSNENCVEVALAVDVVGVRDSKDVDGPVLTVGHSGWRALLRLTT